MSAPRVALQVTIATSLAVSGVIHAYLYIIGYREIPAVGLGFLAWWVLTGLMWQASAFVTLAYMSGCLLGLGIIIALIFMLIFLTVPAERPIALGMLTVVLLAILLFATHVMSMPGIIQ